MNEWCENFKKITILFFNRQNNCVSCPWVLEVSISTSFSTIATWFSIDTSSASNAVAVKQKTFRVDTVEAKEIPKEKYALWQNSFPLLLRVRGCVQKSTLFNFISCISFSFIVSFSHERKLMLTEWCFRKFRAAFHWLVQCTLRLYFENLQILPNFRIFRKLQNWNRLKKSNNKRIASMFNRLR